MLKDTQSNSIRHTQSEIEEFRKLGIELSNIYSTQALSDELIKWIKETANINPKLLEKLAHQYNQKL